NCIFVAEETFMEVEILHLGEVKFEAIARGHRVICDQPATLGGSDSGMTQPARIGRLQVFVTTPELNPKDQAGILRAVKSCLIHATLLNAPVVDIVLNAPVG